MDHVFERLGVPAGTSLVKKRSGSAISVYLMNTSDHSIELKMGTPIAKISMVRDVTSYRDKNFVEMHNLCISRTKQTDQVSAAKLYKICPADTDHNEELIDHFKTLDINQMCAHSTERQRR